MEIKYISHCGFMVELEKMVLVFDYYTGAMPEFDRCKDVYVFVSHRHFDHFNKVIFNLFSDCNVKYILSDDCKMTERNMRCHRIPPDVYEKIIYVSQNVLIEIEGLKIETLPSTDEGVAFIIEAEGRTIYHAGDNGMWLWPDKDDEFRNNMENQYKSIIDIIKGRSFDIAFIPAEIKLGKNAHRGMTYFLRNVNVDKVYPTHLWDKSESMIILLEDENVKKYQNKIVDYFCR